MVTTRPDTMRFEAIGTHWTIEPDPAWHGDYGRLEKRLRRRVDLFDQCYSRFRDDSMVSRMARKSGTYPIPADGQSMLALYRSLYDATDGAVTPLIGQALSDAGYDSAYSFIPKGLAPVPSWPEAMHYADGNLTLARPVLLDFGALGKGRLIDIVAAMLIKTGMTAYCINAGGDLRQHDSAGAGVAVALEHPADTEQAIGIAKLHNQSLCGSAGNRRAWKGYTHILDPHTLTSPSATRAIWVVADSAMLADGLATALYFVAPERLCQIWQFEYAIVEPDGALRKSEGFPAEFFV